MNWDAVWAQVAPLLATVLGLALTWALGELIKWLRERTKGTAFAKAVDVVELLIDTVVKDLQQRVVQSLKEKSEDGKLTPEDIREIQQEAIDYVMSRIPVALRAVIESYLGPLEEYVSRRIEAKVFEMKNEVVAPKSLAFLSGSGPSQ